MYLALPASNFWLESGTSGLSVLDTCAPLAVQFYLLDRDVEPERSFSDTALYRRAVEGTSVCGGSSGGWGTQAWGGSCDASEIAAFRATLC